MSNLKEKTLQSEVLYEGKILTLKLDEVQLPDGKNAKREVVCHSGGVCVAPLDDQGNLYFVRQFRYPYKEVVTELPAGKLEKGQTPLENAKRELLEETGWLGYSFISLGQMYPSGGYTDEIVHLYACKVKTRQQQNLDDDEFIDVEKIPFEKALEMVVNNQIPDGKTQICILKLDALMKSGKI